MGDFKDNRGSSWQYLLLAVPAVAAAIGVQYLVRRHSPAHHSSGDVETAMKPSFYKTPQYEAMTESAKTNHGDADEAEDTTATDRTPADTASPAANKAHHTAQVSGDDDEMSVKTTDVGGGSSNGFASGSAADDKVAASTLNGHLCGPIEYRGDGSKTQISREDWNKLMTEFHDVKDRLLGWFERHDKKFMDKTVASMEQQIRRIEIERPPITQEPDLNWRGVAVFTYDTANKPIIRVGGGFVKLAVKDPARARFELARLVAQSVAPCELQKLGADAAWEPLLKCMDVKEENACVNGTFSDAGWAVSSVLATVVAPPGCVVPAFAMPEVGKCVKKIPLPLDQASASTDDASQASWKEARK